MIAYVLVVICCFHRAWLDFQYFYLLLIVQVLFINPNNLFAHIFQIPTGNILNILFLLRLVEFGWE